MEKAAGKIAMLEQRLDGRIPRGRTAIAHTRWATHGAPTDVNAHPHTDCGGTLAVIHNGIIENAGSLREQLQARGHTFRSETDTEVLAHLIEEAYRDSLELAVAAALRRVEGTYGIAVISSREPDTLVAARHGSPLLVGLGEGENFIASDAAATLAHTRSVIYLDDGEIAVLRPDSYRITDLQTEPVEKVISRVDWDLASVERGGYPHFMLKEIMEQAGALELALRGRLLEDEGNARMGGLNLTDEQLLAVDRVVLTACGTSWHAALIGEYLLEELARIPAEVEYASEFRYRNPIVDERTLVVGISQSGETADTLAALREARGKGGKTLAICNVVESSIARESDGVIYTHAGPEIGVASTKAFTSQVVALLLLALHIGRQRGLTLEEGRDLVTQLAELPNRSLTRIGGLIAAVQHGVSKKSGKPYSMVTLEDLDGPPHLVFGAGEDLTAHRAGLPGDSKRSASRPAHRGPPG